MDDRRRLSFGLAAELYDRRRPTYPIALVEDLIELAGGDGLRAVEVGAGTGKATELFAERGVAIDAVEPGAGMAAILRGKLGDRDNVTIVEGEFEAFAGSFAPSRESYGLLYSAQAWHWIDPDQRYALARAVLAPGALLAPFWNRPVWDENPIRVELDEVYTRLAPELSHDGPMRPGGGARDEHGSWEEQIAAAPEFDRAEVRSYEWQTSYTAEEYTELLATHSDHAVLDPNRRAALLEAVAEVIDRAGGELPYPYVTRLCLARAV